MKKRFLLFFIGIFFCSTLVAHHIVGGDMRYEFVSSNGSSTTYRITLRLFRDDNCSGGCPVLPTNATLGIFDNDTNQEFPGSNDSVIVTRVGPPQRVPVNAFPSCITNPPDIKYSETDYIYTVTLPNNHKGYTVSYQTCCRIDPLENAVPPDPNTGLGPGSTYSCYISGQDDLNGLTNSSPKFNTVLSVICQNKPFTFDFSAVDPDMDSLIYSFAPAYDRGNAHDSSYVNPSAPPYQSIQYFNGYTFADPMGLTATIDPHTGIISGNAPNIGRYVVCVLVTEYRNGKQIGIGRKDFIINVADCSFAGAKLNPRPTTCDGFTVTFSNDNNSPLNLTYYWDFGDGDTSTQATPTHTYKSPNDYKYKLVVNRGQSCADSATQIMRVYPGFNVGFKSSTPCVNKSIQFTDTTNTAYGVVDTWRYNFSDPNNSNDTSHLQNPVYTYSKSGVYNVSFTATNSKGCIKTVVVPVNIINNPIVAVSFSDTTYCGKDSIQLSATADYPSKFSWSPQTNIVNPNTANPRVFPSVATTYTVTADAGGCTGSNSVTVRPANDLQVSVSTSNPSICDEDTLALTASSNHSPIKYMWSPNYNINHPDSNTAMVYPHMDTTYTATGLWGNGCTATGSIKIRVKQLAKPVAGPSQGFCQGRDGVQLNASGGDEYIWSPSSGLNNSNIPNPIAKPDVTTKYLVGVGVTGCSKLKYDSLVVTVHNPPSFTKTNDTLICSIDTLQLNANAPAGGQFVWTPNYNIINPNTSSPQVYPKKTFTYYVNLTDQFTCTKLDSVLVNVKDVVSIYAGPDTSICQTDTIKLNPVSDALHYNWSPTASIVSSDTAKYPLVRPLSTTTYTVIGNIGKCSSSSSVKVKVVPYPVRTPTRDTSICYGDTVHLSASGGSVYTWTPVFFLSNPNIADPLAVPQRSIRYIVRVSDTLGCPKPVYDSTIIKVADKINADAGPQDTSVVLNQPLQLFGSGGQNYLWSPPRGLNDPNIYDPVATLSSDITYLLRVGNGTGCFAYDSIKVHLYTVLPGLYIPNAFTPNNNGRNDVFRPVAIGIKKINYFKIFDRWGQLMFQTTEVNKGWDGTFKGKPQDPAVFVWIVQAVDFNDKVITQKGTVVLIR